MSKGLSNVIYQLRITLLDTDPPVWRVVLVPATLTLKELHEVAQVVMGWENRHLHEFRMKDKVFGEPTPDELMGLPGLLDEAGVSLIRLLPGIGKRIRYTYDLGDHWEHEIVLEEVLESDPQQIYPTC